MCRTTRLLSIARKLCKERSTEMRFPLVSLITKGSKILSVGYNEFGTHPVAVNTRQISIHAEMDAINRLGYTENEKLTIYVYRHRRVGAGLAKPCEACMALIKMSNIKKVVYTNSSIGNSLSYSVINL